MWSIGVPCSAGTPMGMAIASLPSFDGAEYTVALSAEVHPVAGLNLAPGAKITLQPDTMIDFSGDPDASCPAVQTTTTTTTTATGTTTTIYNPANVDCVETVSPCTAACEPAAQRAHAVLVPAVAAGRACVGATDCQPGDDLCPAPTTTTVGGAGIEDNADEGGITNEDGTIDISAATEVWQAAASSSNGFVISAGGVDYRASGVIEGVDGNTMFITFPTLDLAAISDQIMTLLDSAMVAASVATLGVAPEEFEFGAADGGGTKVIVYITAPVAEPVPEEKSGSSIVIIIGVVVALLLCGAIIFFSTRGNGDDVDGQLPKSMPASAVGQARAVENPLYADPDDATDGYMDVEAPDGAGDAAAAAPKKKKKDDSGKITKKAIGKRCMVEGFDCDGTIRFFGPHHETGKDKVGVELDEAVGKHAGTVKGNEYFTCGKKCGILVDPKKVAFQAMV